MMFQFLCPRGHLLQDDESQAGQRCKCPYCESEFLVPQASRDPRPDHLPVARAEPDSLSSTGHKPPPAREPSPGEHRSAPPPRPAAAGHEPPSPPEPPAAEDVFPGIRTGGKVAGDPAEVSSQLGFGDAGQRDLLHIPCPKGHPLETPREMLGQDAMCPFCQSQFRLRLEHSQEYQREKAERRERRERKLGKAWLHWTIATAVVVILGVILLVAVSVYR